MAQAIQYLNVAVPEASKHGFVGYQYDAELLLDDMELQSGLGELCRRHLEALRKKAPAAGFNPVAQRAADVWEQTVSLVGLKCQQGWIMEITELHVKSPP